MVNAKHERIVDEAIRAGKLPAASRDDHLGKLAENERSHTAYLASLAPVLTPPDADDLRVAREGSEPAVHAAIMAGAYGIDVEAGDRS